MYKKNRIVFRSIELAKERSKGYPLIMALYQIPKHERKKTGRLFLTYADVLKQDTGLETAKATVVRG